MGAPEAASADVRRTDPPPDIPPPLEQGRYRLYVAETERDIDAALRLRFDVFNVELAEGLAASWSTGRDEDEFDPQFHHLIVEDRASSRVIGTYRLQTSSMAAAARGLYSATEFDLSEFPPEVLEGSVEVGRACIDKAYRNRQVLYLLWKGLASYVEVNAKRYLFGCSSLTSQDPAVGMAALRDFSRRGLLHPTLRARPLPGCECNPSSGSDAGGVEVAIPVLFGTYLRFGGKICGPPAIDRAFRTIDFLTVLDVTELEPHVRRLFFG